MVHIVHQRLIHRYTNVEIHNDNNNNNELYIQEKPKNKHINNNARCHRGSSSLALGSVAARRHRGSSSLDLG